MKYKPNFFIVGAPKCGTTAMSEYLRSHPNVFMSVPKEPNYFSSELGINRRSIDHYLNLFSDAGPRHTVIAEASTTYIFSQSALERIRHFNPDAKLMVMLRQPSDLVYAFHGQCVWALQTVRAAGNSLPPLCPSSQLLQYKWIASIGSQVERLFEIFPRAQVHTALLDDLALDPRREYLRLLSFLDLPDDGRVDFPRVNEAKSHKWLWLGQMPRLLRRRFNSLYFMLRQKTNFRGTGLIRMIDYFNTEARPRPPLSPEFKRYLDEVFYDEVRLLEELLERDLSAWRTVYPDSTSRTFGRENVSPS
jgi:hypothetical protein